MISNFHFCLKNSQARRIRIDEGIADVVWAYYYYDDDDDDASASSSKAPLLKMEEEDGEVFVIQTVQKPTVFLGSKKI